VSGAPGATLRPVWKAIFWDNDGVLVDTEGLYYQATREVLATVGVSLSEEAYVELFLRQSKGAWHLAVERGVNMEAIPVLRRRRDDRFGALIDAGPTAIAGVAEVVRRLAARYRMAIVTSSEHFDRIHRDPTFVQLFEFVLTPAHYRVSKPDPEPYLRALGRSGLAAHQCLVIEDSERGLRAAKAAGLTCWVVPSRFTRRCAFEGADRIFESVAAVEVALAEAAR
jgi:HAD superfamily hydrolase (TIGR01509 family)